MRWCWKQPFKGSPKVYHAQLNSTLLSTWAHHIVEGVSTLHHPPRIPDFDDIILAPLLKKHKPSAADIMQPIHGGTGLAPQVTIIREARGPSSKRYYEDESPSPRKRRRHRISDTSYDSFSDISEAAPAINTSPSLTPFKIWCKTYNPAIDWDECFAKLKQDDIGTDSLSAKMKPSKLAQLCTSSGLKEATAMRILKAFKRWKRAGEPAS